MRAPLISIITICYNEKHIERTCISVIHQTFQDFEWIVIDGGSTDGRTLQILQKYRNRMNCFISEKDKGRYNAMNKGIKKARGKWLIFMNGGDTFYDYDVLKKVFYHKLYKGIDVLYGNPCFVLGAYRKIIPLPPSVEPSFFKDNCINHQSSFIKAPLFKKYGLYDERYQIISDRLKWIEFCNHHCTFFHLDTTIGSFNLEGISSIPSKIYNEEMDKILRLNLKKDNYLDKKYTVISVKKTWLTFIIKMLK